MEVSPGREDASRYLPCQPWANTEDMKSHPQLPQKGTFSPHPP